ncbi:MAG: NAD(P)/FAD-dependent oxidoreductase [Hyphomonadaceae bacterium]
MARTRLFGEVENALAQARQALGEPTPPMRAISRRAALALMAAAAACTPSPDAPEASTEEEGDAGTVAIVGGGVSGLVAAWRLAIAGVPTEIFESTGRTGGRMYTLRDFTPEGQFCELGGEFVSSTDEALIRLCAELGVGLERLGLEGAVASTVYDFGGKQFTDTDLVDPVAMTGDFLPAAALIAADQAALLDGKGEWTARAHELDAMPLSKYLERLAPTTQRWVIDLIALAWQSEFGISLEQQSSLNLVDLIGASNAGFSMFGKHDGAFRIAGGSSSLPEVLTERLSSSPLSAKTTIRLRHQLYAVSRGGEGVQLSFRPEGGVPLKKTYARVILALPFTRLRNLKGLGGLGLPADKMKVINELGYGANAKLAVGTSSRPWQEGLAGVPAPVTGTLYSDRGFELMWDTSAAQPGIGGVLTNYLSGDAAKREEAQALARLEAGLAALSPKVARSLMPKVRASFFWPNHPHTRGSYAGCLTGQYTSFAGVGARPELDGRLLFAGEHTSAIAMGSMNGAVDAGERAAREVMSMR